MKVDNEYIVWKYTGEVVARYQSDNEIYKVSWVNINKIEADSRPPSNEGLV